MKFHRKFTHIRDEFNMEVLRTFAKAFVEEYHTENYSPLVSTVRAFLESFRYDVVWLVGWVKSVLDCLEKDRSSRELFKFLDRFIMRFIRKIIFVQVWSDEMNLC